EPSGCRHRDAGHEHPPREFQRRLEGDPFRHQERRDGRRSQLQQARAVSAVRIWIVPSVEQADDQWFWLVWPRSRVPGGQLRQQYRSAGYESAIQCRVDVRRTGLRDRNLQSAYLDYAVQRVRLLVAAVSLLNRLFLNARRGS